MKAARWHGHTWQAFCDLDGDDQAFLIAVYETVMQEEGVEFHEAQKK